MIKKLILATFSLIAVIGLTACNKLDVIGDRSVGSFDAVLNNMGDKVSEATGFGGWSLAAPDGTARFEWSKDFSKTTANDVQLIVDAKPFVDAGLDVSKLPEGMLSGDSIVVGTELGNDVLTYDGEATPLASYKQILHLYRDNIKYHLALDHYGIALSGGNMIEWAKDMTTNDKDLVFVLNPEVFLSAGVDPAKVAGWVFATVQTMDDNGKKIEVEKFLKPFDLDGKPAK